MARVAALSPEVCNERKLAPTAELSFEDFLAQYGKAKSEIEVLMGWQNAIPMKTASYQEALTKYRIQLGLAMLANTNSTPSLRIHLRTHTLESPTAPRPWFHRLLGSAKLLCPAAFATRI